MPPKTQQRQQHAKKACVACRKAHTACTDIRPCTRCNAKGLECVDEEELSRPIPISSLSQHAHHLPVIPPPKQQSQQHSQPYPYFQHAPSPAPPPSFAYPQQPQQQPPPHVQQQQQQQQQQQLPNFAAFNYSIHPPVQQQHVPEQVVHHHHGDFLKQNTILHQQQQVAQQNNTPSPASTFPYMASPQASPYYTSPLQQQQHDLRPHPTTPQVKSMYAPPQAPQNPAIQTSNLSPSLYETNEMKEASKQRNELLAACQTQIQQMDTIISKHDDMLKLLLHQQKQILDMQSRQISSTSHRPIFDHAAWHFVKLPKEFEQPISFWDKNTVVLLACNKAFCDMTHYTMAELQLGTTRLFKFTPDRLMPYSEITLHSMLASNIRYFELNSIWRFKNGTEKYLKHNIRVEDSFFWMDHVPLEVVSDEYRMDEYVQVKNFESKADENIMRRFVPPANRIYAFLDIMNRISNEKKPKDISEIGAPSSI